MSKPYSAENIKRISDEARATVKRAREAIRRMREGQDATGYTRETTQQAYENLSASSRAWIDAVLDAAVARVQQSPVAAVGTPVHKAHKIRTIV